MKFFTLFFLFTLSKCFSTVLFNPSYITEESICYYSGSRSYYPPPFQREIVPENNRNHSIIAPTLIVDLFSIVHQELLYKMYEGQPEPPYNGETGNIKWNPKCEFPKSLWDVNHYLFEKLYEHTGDWQNLFEQLFDKISEQYEHSDGSSKLKWERLMRRKNLFNQALNMEVEALANNEILVWRFSGVPLDKELKETESRSFALSLLGGYICDGFINKQGEPSACTFVYVDNLLNSRKELGNAHLYAIKISQEWLSDNLQTSSKVDGAKRLLPTLGKCPALLQALWGRGELFHPRIIPTSLTENMILNIPLDLNSSGSK